MSSVHLTLELQIIYLLSCENRIRLQLPFLLLDGWQKLFLCLIKWDLVVQQDPLLHLLLLLMVQQSQMFCWQGTGQESPRSKGFTTNQWNCLYNKWYSMLMILMLCSPLLIRLKNLSYFCVISFDIITRWVYRG